MIKKIIKFLKLDFTWKHSKEVICFLFKHDFKQWENQYGYGYTCKRCGTKIYTTLTHLKKLLKNDKIKN